MQEKDTFSPAERKAQKGVVQLLKKIEAEVDAEFQADWEAVKQKERAEMEEFAQEISPLKSAPEDLQREKEPLDWIQKEAERLGVNPRNFYSYGNFVMHQAGEYPEFQIARAIQLEHPLISAVYPQERRYLLDWALDRGIQREQSTIARFERDETYFGEKPVEGRIEGIHETIRQYQDVQGRLRPKT